MYEYKDKEFPSALDEATKNINTRDLAKLLKSSLKAIDGLRITVNEAIDTLGGKDKVINSDVDSILNLEKEVEVIHRKFVNNINGIK